MNVRFIFPVIFCFLTITFLGCSAIKEVGKGFAGVSTQILEDKRKDALKKSFAINLDDCYLKVKDILKEKNKESYIYSEDLKTKMIAIYLSLTDTTPVGIFFSEEVGSKTLIEISSPSVYAKEEIANRIFKQMAALTKPKIIQENKNDLKEEAFNK